MRFVIGIDSGGTNYRVRASDLSGNKLGEYIGETANHYYLEYEEVLRRINQSIDFCLEQFSGKREDCSYLVCGTTGLDSEEDAALLNHIYATLPGMKCPVRCMNDVELAHYTVTHGEGVLIISGTGAIAYGRNSKGESACVGGWPISIMGEEGSGTWVTRHALRHMARYFDQIVPETPLIRKIQESLQIYTPKQLNDLSVSIMEEQEKQPQLGNVVDEAAKEGDIWAIRLMEKAAQATVGLLEELLERLDIKKQDSFPVGIWGSNILNSQVHLSTFKQLLEQRYPNAVLKVPDCSALDGAVKLALEYHTKLEEKL